MSILQHLPGRRTAIAGAAGVVIGLVIAGGAWWFTAHESTAQAATPTTVTRTVAAATDTIRKSISTSGTLTPALQQDVSFLASGTVTDIAVAAGDQVVAGQPLATVDTLTMQQTLASARLTLAKAQAALADDQTAATTAQDTLTSAQDTGDDTTAESLAVTTAQQQVDVDQTSVDLAQTQVDTAQTALNTPTLVAPIDGVVSTVNVAVGQKVTGTSATTTSSGSGTGSSAGTSGSGAGSTGSATGTTGSSSSSAAAFVIVGTTSWNVDVTVDDAQIGLVAVGDQAQLAVTGSPDPLFGTIASVGLISTASGETASYPVVVGVTGSPAGLHDGTAVTVTLIYQQLTDVLTVPSAAIRTVNGATVVDKVSGDQQVTTVVVTGDTDGTNTQITSGLNEGDQVTVTTTTGTGGTSRTGTGSGSRNGTGTGTGGFTGGGGFSGGANGAGGGNPGGGIPGAPAGG